MLAIRKMNEQSYYIVDTSVPGGKDLEHQTSRERAGAALARWEAKQGEGIRLVHSADDAPATASQTRREMLAAQLKGKAGDVRARIARVASLEDLEALAEMEAEGLGRKTVLSAIQRAAKMSASDRVTGA